MTKTKLDDRYSIDFSGIGANESQEYIPNSESGLDSNTGLSLEEVCDMILDPSVDSGSLLDIPRFNYKKDKIIKCLESKIDVENAAFQPGEEKKWAIVLTESFFHQKDSTKESVLNSFSEDFLYVIGLDEIIKNGVIPLNAMQYGGEWTNDKILNKGIDFVVGQNIEDVLEKHSRAISNIIQDIRFRFK